MKSIIILLLVFFTSSLKYSAQNGLHPSIYMCKSGSASTRIYGFIDVSKLKSGEYKDFVFKDKSSKIGDAAHVLLQDSLNNNADYAYTAWISKNNEVTLRVYNWWVKQPKITKFKYVITTFN